MNITKTVTLTRNDYNDKLNFLIITPAVSIDQNFINSSCPTHYIADKINLNAQNTSQTVNNYEMNYQRDNEKYWTNNNVPIILHNKRTGMVHTFTKASNSRQWCTLICSAIKCFGIHFGFSASTATVALNTACCSNSNINSAHTYVSTDNP